MGLRNFMYVHTIHHPAPPTKLRPRSRLTEGLYRLGDPSWDSSCADADSDSDYGPPSTHEGARCAGRRVYTAISNFRAGENVPLITLDDIDADINSASSTPSTAPAPATVPARVLLRTLSCTLPILRPALPPPDRAV